MSDTVKVRIKQRPDEEIEVSAHEAEILRGQGLLADGAKSKRAPSRQTEEN